MFTFRSVVPSLVLSFLCSRAMAVTGSVTINAACIGPFGSPYLCGYNDGALGGGTLGAASNVTLSDGKTVSDFADVGGGGVTLRIGGFTSDPGKTYFNYINVSCIYTPTTMSSASSSYAYTSSTGYAVWSWSRTDWCMQFPGSYSLGVN
jgi:hypothetical protein